MVSSSQLTKQVIPVSFDGGIDTKTAKELVIPGRFLLLENCIRRQGSKVQKRNGFSALGKKVFNSTPIDSGKKLARFVDDVLLMNQRRIYSYAAASDKWLDKGEVVSALVSSNSLIRNSYVQATPDMVSSNGVTVVVWEDSRGGCRFSTVDDATGASFMYDQLLNADAAWPRVVAIRNHFVIGYINTATDSLCTRYIARVNPATVSSEQVLLTGVVEDAPWDIETLDSASIFAVNNTSAEITYGYITEYGALGSPGTNGYPNTKSITAPGRDSLTVSTQSSTSRIYISYYDAADEEVRVFATDSNFAASDDELVEDTSAIGIVRNIGTCMMYNDNLRLFYEFDETEPRNASIRMSTAFWNNVTLVVGTPAEFKRSVGLASKPFALGQFEYVNCAFESSLQSTYFTIKSNGFITTRMSPGLGGGLSRDSARALKSILPRVSYDVDGDQVFPVQFISRLEAESSTVSADNIGVNKITLEFNTTSFDNETLGDNLHIAGGVLLGYDGVSATELGFHVFPEDVSAAVNTGTGSFPGAGQYAYRVIYEWVDGKGQIHRSAPSILETATLAAGTDEITLTIPTLRLTQKTGNRADVKVVIYRSDVDLVEVLYRLTDFDNDTTADEIVYVDDNGDATGLTSREILYTTGGELENIAPPSSKVVHKHKNRLFVAGLEDGNAVEYSKENIFGEGVAFSDVLTFRTDPLGGDITAFSTLDDKLVIFKRDRIFTLAGDGPLPSGAQNDYAQPQLVSGDVGTVMPQSVIIMPLGVMFQSDKGIMLLSRSLEVVAIGNPVDAYKSNMVTSAVLVEDDYEVRFTTLNGPALVYNYNFNQWSTFSNYAAISAIRGPAGYMHLKENGTVNQELSDLYEDNGSKIKMSIETSWFSFAGVQGYQRIYWISILGDFLSHHFTKIQLAYDFENVYSETRYYDTRTGQSQTTFGTGIFGAESPFGGQGSSVYQYRQKPRRQKCESMKVRMEDIDTQSTTGGASFALTHMAFTMGVKEGSNRMGESKTGGRA